MSAYFAEKDELGFLGAILSGDIDTTWESVGLIQPSMLTHEEIRLTFEVVGELAQENKPATLENVQRAWRKSHSLLPLPLATWQEAMANCPSASLLTYHSDGIKEAYQRRKLRDLANQILSDSSDCTVSLDKAIQHLEAGMVLEAQAKETADGKEAVMSFIDAIQERWKRNGELSGVPTGIPKLDSMLDGLQYKELTLVAARPSIGKTAMGTSIIAKATVEHRIPTLFVSCEMSTTAITRRLVSTISSVPMQSIKTGQLNDKDMARLNEANLKVKNSPIHFADFSSGARIGAVTAAIRKAVRKHKVRLVIVDYLQKISASGRHEKRTYEVAEVSGTLKACASSTGVAMLALAQLNRESEKEKGRKPRLSDLADSGQIERDADTVLLLDRNRVEPKGEATISIAKQRDGECGVVECWYEGQFCRFEPALLQEQ